MFLCADAEFMGLIEEYKQLLSLDLGPLQVAIGPANIAVNDEEALMKLLPHLYSEWQRQKQLMPQPPTSAFPQHGVSVSHHSVYQVPSVAPRRISITDTTSAGIIEVQTLQSVGAADFRTMRLGVGITPDDQPGGSSPPLQLYSNLERGIPCLDNPAAALLTPSSKVRVAHRGSISRLTDSTQAVVGSVWRTKQAVLPGNY